MLVSLLAAAELAFLPRCGGGFRDDVFLTRRGGNVGALFNPLPSAKEISLSVAYGLSFAAALLPISSCLPNPSGEGLFTGTDSERRSLVCRAGKVWTLKAEVGKEEANEE